MTPHRLFAISPILLFTVLILSGCSHRELYQSVQQMQKSRCNTVFQQAQYEECLADTRMSYYEYENARQEAMHR